MIKQNKWPLVLPNHNKFQNMVFLINGNLVIIKMVIIKK